MKKIVTYIIVTALALLVPEYGTDVGKLIPVELVFLYKEGEKIVIETDTEDIGRGKTVDEAVRNLTDTTPGEIFLDTADYLLVSEDALVHLNEMNGYLKGKVWVCLAGKGIDVKTAVQYLAVHKPGATIRAGTVTEELKVFEGRYVLN